MSNYAIVHKDSEHKRCKVVKYGAQLLRYGKNQVHWVESPKDELAVLSRLGDFCVLYKKDWEEGDRLSCICGHCGEDLELDNMDDVSEDPVYKECSTCNDW